MKKQVKNVGSVNGKRRKVFTDFQKKNYVTAQNCLRILLFFQTLIKIYGIGLS